MADGASQAESNISYHEVSGFPGLGVCVLRFPCQVPHRARCKLCNCVPRRIYPLLCPHHGLCLHCKKYCDGFYCHECQIHTTPEQLGAQRPDYNLDGLLLKVLCDVCDKELLLGELEEHMYEHTNQCRKEASKVQERTNQHKDVSEKPVRVSDAVSERCHFCNENVKNSDSVEHLKMHIEKQNNQGDSIVQGTPNQTHKSQCPKMERECSDCGGNVLNENLQHHLDTECRKRVVRCGACNRLMCYDERDIHRSECPKIERKCIDCGINVLNENLQNHKEVECQKRVVLCDACKSAMYYDEHADHKQECLEKPVVCDDCKGEVLRKEKSKHVSECPMRNVGCENCKGFYAFSLERDASRSTGLLDGFVSRCEIQREKYVFRKEHKEQCEIKKLSCKYCKLELKDDDEHHQTECQRPPELSKRGPIEKKSVPSVSLNAPAPPSPMGPQVASMKDHDSSSTKSCTDEEKKYCKFCERPVKKCNYEKHLEVCSKREEECGHCSLTVLREEWKTHEDICEKNPANIKPEPAPSVSKLGEKGKKHLTSDNKAKNSWPARQLLHSDKKAMDTIMELQQKIEEMERCNMALREEARSEKAKLVKIIQELENRQVEPNTFN